jgi:predicted permease
MTRFPSTFADAAIAMRLMRKQPVLTITTILALATGIGMATTGFTLLEAVLYAKLPFAGGDRFVLVDVYEDPAARRVDVDDARLHALRGGVPALRHLGAARTSAINLLLPSGDVVLLTATFITPDSFSVLPYPPLAGRTLNAGDGRAGAPAVALLRESAWRRHFSGDPSIVGRTANFAGVHRIIVGVMPDSLEFPAASEAWLPLDAAAGAAMFGVLAEGGTERVATEQLMAISRQFEVEHPDARPLRLEALTFTKAVSRGLDLLAAAVVAILLLVLLVIAANVANLVLARTLARSTELAVRTALGATRARLVGQIFVEVILLGTIAAIAGLVASQFALRWVTLTLTDMPFWVDFSASPRTMAFVVAVTLLAAAVGGVLPALKVTRRNTALAMSAAGRRVSPGFGRVGSAMIAMQIALSIAMLNAALVMARGVSGYMEGGPALPVGQLLTAQLVINDGARTAPRHAEIVDVVRRLPGVSEAGLSTSLPRLSPRAVMTSVRIDALSEASEPRAAPAVASSQGFLEALGARALAGRLFEPGDFSGRANPVAIVNEPFVQKFFGGANPVGRQLRRLETDASDQSEPWREIIGVVPDLGLSAGDELLAAGYYVPMKDEWFFHVTLRAAGGVDALGRPLRSALAQYDPRIQVRDVLPLEKVGAEDRTVFAGIGAALTALGGIALLLSVIGVYAMLSFSVTQRTREIAIRSALGASRAQVLRAVLGRASVPLLVGIIAGPALSGMLVAARGIFAFRLPADSGPWGLPLVCALMIGAGLISSWLPARRALRITTSDALRAE